MSKKRERELKIWEEGYRAGKRSANADLYAEGYSDAFNELREQIEALLEEQANSPIPARFNQPT